MSSPYFVIFLITLISVSVIYAFKQLSPSSQQFGNPFNKSMVQMQIASGKASFGTKFMYFISCFIRGLVTPLFIFISVLISAIATVLLALFVRYLA